MKNKTLIKPEIYYIHDPMCSWCWAFSHSYSKLFHRLDKNITVKRLLGGLAADSDEAMSEETRKMVQNAWHSIEKKIPGKKFNFDFWIQNTPRRSTYPACRAVIAARNQGEEYDLVMTSAIQKAYYQNAQNPSDLSVLFELATDIGLNSSVFQETINSVATHDILLNEIKQARSLNVSSFPSLLLKQSQSIWSIPIDYKDEKPMLEMVDLILSDSRDC